MLCELFSKVSRAWDGSFNVTLNYVLCAFTGAVTLHRALVSPELVSSASTAACLASLALACVCFEVARRMDPGIVTRDNVPPQLLATAGAGDKVQMCHQCNVPRCERAFHCKLCGFCTSRFDHHCAYLNRCVARRNMPPFFAMLCAFEVYLVLGCRIVWTTFDADSPSPDVLLMLLCMFFQASFGLAVFLLLGGAIRRISINMTTYEITKPPAYFASGNRFNLGVQENWAACCDAWSHESSFYAPLPVQRNDAALEAKIAAQIDAL
jgi:hypothetical protein